MIYDQERYSQKTIGFVVGPLLKIQNPGGLWDHLIELINLFHFFHARDSKRDGLPIPSELTDKNVYAESESEHILCDSVRLIKETQPLVTCITICIGNYDRHSNCNCDFAMGFSANSWQKLVFAGTTYPHMTACAEYCQPKSRLFSNFARPFDQSESNQ